MTFHRVPAPGVALCAFLVGAAARAQDTTSAPTAPAALAAQIQIDGLIQVWYLDGHTITNAHDSYRVRRAGTLCAPPSLVAV
jgi:hypothetical protein